MKHTKIKESGLNDYANAFYHIVKEEIFILYTHCMQFIQTIEKDEGSCSNFPVSSVLGLRLCLQPK